MSVSEKIVAIKAFLASTSIFQNLCDEQLNAVANIGIVQTYKKGETLFWEGEPGTGFFIVKSGRVKVFKVAAGGKEQILHLFGEAEYFAEVPMFDGGNFPASAMAIETTAVVFIPRDPFLAVLQQHPTLAIAMLSNFSRHLRRLAGLVDSLSFKEVPERLANYLLSLSEGNGNAAVIELDVSKGQLAALLGTIPETLSRAFYKLSQEGVIEMEGVQIRLCDRDQLLKLGHKQ